ncbi:Vps62-related protein [Actinomadura craniellae]|uniref:Vps62-related protein n=1 Tax=Actinomadura craniellae TaxID=2231787 RepID=UPI0013148A2C|nr:Vps62-related protein [Actinomadura craniellae]
MTTISKDSVASRASVISKDFGELTLAFTDQFTFCWNDRSTGGSDYGGFWHPQPPEGFFALGSIVRKGWGTDNIQQLDGGSAGRLKEYTTALCVKPSAAGEKAVKSGKAKPQLAAPTGYERIWKDAKSGGKYYGCIWRPIAPAGYVPLGCVASPNTYDEPPTSAIMCVREDLTYLADLSASYSDRGTGATEDLSTWLNVTPSDYAATDDTLGLIAAGTFTAVPNHSRRPDPQRETRVLRLAMPIDEAVLGKPPALTDRNPPPPTTDEIIVASVWMPYTAVKDTARTDAWKFANSPFYQVQRTAAWRRLQYLNNDTGRDQPLSDVVTVGWEKGQTHGWSVNVGFEISTTNSLGTGPVSASTTFKFTAAFGATGSYSAKESSSHTKSRTFTVPSNHAGAMWVGHEKLRIVRADNTIVGSTLSCDTELFAYDQYPDD